MTNGAISDQFAFLAKLMELHGENAFRTRNYSSAALAIDKLQEPLAGMDEATLLAQHGVGQSIADKIQELLDTGEMTTLVEYLQATPPGVLEILKIKGLGPKKVAVIWKEMGITDLGELEYACDENRLAAFKGFGGKTQEKVLTAIHFYNAQLGLHLYASCIGFASAVLEALHTKFPSNKTELSGDYRRQTPILGNIDIITTVSKIDLKQWVLDELQGELTELEEGKWKISVPQQADLVFHFSTEEAFHTILFISTGSNAFITDFTSRYTIPATAESEEAIFESNSLPFITAPQREASRKDVFTNPTPQSSIITRQDIKGIIHSHSTYSDGANTLQEMTEGAKAAGFEYLVISDHSQAAQYAGGLRPDEILAQHKEIDVLNKELAPFKIFKSIEADILGDGNLDYTDEILASFDLVIASVHSNLTMTEEKAMGRLLKAIANPYTTILGHMTGRLLLSRAGYPVNHELIIAACKKNSVVIEINAHPRRLDMDWEWMNVAINAGVLLSIDPDAHSIAGFQDVAFGVLAAQKAGLQPSQNLSSLSLADFELFIKKNRPKSIH